jgi:hypothetical protein
MLLRLPLWHHPTTRTWQRHSLTMWLDAQLRMPNDTRKPRMAQNARNPILSSLEFSSIVASQDIQRKFRSPGEPHRFVEDERACVFTEHMQEWNVTHALDLVHEV